ncbi:hypothetical protein MUN89_06755 [Halobacillus salinarum]|uniref:Uncharacterized protein n=1 Tax=Halobacillus salinarum TaxID=2932257 RepID=A0ABY4EML4_9BACI|nr:hypothetical protein [Halobacillus salinarum]UOQ45630.1 hypothetical protein MUN89_06755 [Halobacillus salinarum]
MDDWQLNVEGHVSVRIDKTIVIEPIRQMTEDSLKRFIRYQTLIQKVIINTKETMAPIELFGPYQLKRSFGILVLKRI